VNRVHFSSQTDLWSSPQWLVDRLEKEIGKIDLDVCALPSNAKARHYFTPQQDGLKQKWEGVIWMNPPYGREIGRWVEKAYRSSLAGATCICLLPARTDTKWFFDYVTRASEIRFFRGRLKFGDARHTAPFPSVLVIFRPPTTQTEPRVKFLDPKEN
jgi:phage N-6-adenine-methyltransferase